MCIIENNITTERSKINMPINIRLLQIYIILSLQLFTLIPQHKFL